MFIEEKKEITLPQKEKSGYTASQDRRYLPRWEVDNKIFFKKENEIMPHECRGKDIHCAGACIRTREEIPLNQKLNLTIYLADDIDPIHVRGRALWLRRQDNENLVGIQFDSVREKVSDIIFSYAFEYRRDELMKLWFKDF